MKLTTEDCTKKARTGWKRKMWWEEPEGEEVFKNQERMHRPGRWLHRGAEPLRTNVTHQESSRHFWSVL